MNSELANAARHRAKQEDEEQKVANRRRKIQAGKDKQKANLLAKRLRSS